MPGELFHPTLIARSYRELNPGKFDDIDDKTLLDAIRDIDPETYKLVNPQLLGAEILDDSRKPLPTPPTGEEVPKPALPSYHPPPSFTEEVLTGGLRTVPGMAAGMVGALGGPAVGMAAGAAGMGAGDVVAQGLERYLGTREDYSPTETAIQAGLGLVPLGEVSGMGPFAATAVRAGQGALISRAGGLTESLVTGAPPPPAFRQYATGAVMGGLLHGAGEVYGAAREAPSGLGGVTRPPAGWHPPLPFPQEQEYGLPMGPGPRSTLAEHLDTMVTVRQMEAQEISKEFSKRGWEIPPSQRGTLAWGLENKRYLETLANAVETEGLPLSGGNVTMIPPVGPVPPPAPPPQRLLPASPIIGYGPEGPPPPSDLVVPGNPQRGVVAQPTIDRLTDQLEQNLYSGPPGPPRLSTEQQLRLTPPPEAPEGTPPLLPIGGPPSRQPLGQIEKPATPEQPYLEGVTTPEPVGGRVYPKGPNVNVRREGESHGEPRRFRRRVAIPGTTRYRFEQAPTTLHAEDPGTYPPEVRRELARMLHELETVKHEQVQGGLTRQQIAAMKKAMPDASIGEVIAELRRRGASAGGALPGAPVYHDIIRDAQGGIHSGITRAEMAAKLRQALLDGRGSAVSDAAAQVARERLARAETGPRPNDRNVLVDAVSGERRTRYQTVSQPGAGDHLIGWVDEAGNKALPEQDLSPEQQAAREASSDDIRMAHRVYQQVGRENLSPETLPHFDALIAEGVRKGIIRPEQLDLRMEGPGGAGGPKLTDFEGGPPPKKRESQKSLLPTQEAAIDNLEQMLVERYGPNMANWPEHLRRGGTFKEGEPPPALPTATRPLPPDVPPDTPIIKTPDEYRQFVRRYGPPNAVDVGEGVFGAKSGSMFIDDDTGQIVGFAWPETRPPARPRSEYSQAELDNLFGKGKYTAEAPPEAQPSLPGAEGVRQTETPTPEVAEAPFALTPEAAERRGTQPSLLGEGPPPERPRQRTPEVVTQEPQPPIGERRPASLFDRLFDEEGTLIIPKKLAGDRPGFKKWLADQEKEHGDETWFNRAEEAVDAGDWDRAWKIASAASVRSYARLSAAASTPQEEEALRRAVKGTILQSDIQTQIVGQARGRTTLRGQPRAPRVEDLPPSFRVSQAGAARAPQASLGPAGIINPGPPQRPLPIGQTDAILSRAAQRTLIQNTDPTLLHLIPGNTDTNLLLFRQIADLAFQGMNTRELKQYLNLSNEEIAQHFLRAPTWAGRVLQELSAYRQANRATLDRAAEAISMGGALEGMLGPPPLIVGSRGRVVGRVGQVEAERTLESLAEDTRSFDALMTANALQSPKQLTAMEGLTAASYPFMISKWATAVRNAITQGGRYGMEALDEALTIPIAELMRDPEAAALAKSMARERAAAPTRGGAYVPPTRAWKDTIQDVYDLASHTMEQSGDAKATLKVLTEFPTEAANFLGWASSAGEEAGAGRTSSTIVNALMDSRLARLLTVFNRAQEFTGRALVYDASMRAQLRARGLDPNEILQLSPAQIADRVGGATVLDELIHNSVAGALEATFASRAAKNSIPGTLLQWVNRAWPLKLGYPFPKFNLVSAPRFVWDHGPWALIDLARFPLDAVGLSPSELFVPGAKGRLYRGVQARKFERVDIPELVGKRAQEELRLSEALRDRAASRREQLVQQRLIRRLEAREANQSPLFDPSALEAARQQHDQLARRVARAEEAKDLHSGRIKDLRSQEEKLLQTVRDAHAIGAPNLSQYFARIGTGTFAGLGAAFVIRSQPGAQGTKWYEYRIDREGKDPITLDFRPFAPFAQYLFVADVMQDFWHNTDWEAMRQEGSLDTSAGPFEWSRSMWEHYKGKYTAQELGSQFSQAFLSMSRAAGTTLTISELMTANGWPGPQEAADAIIGTIGQFLSRFTVPLQQVKDLAGAFDPEEAKARITPRATLDEPFRPLADPLANVPYLSRVIPERTSQTTGQPVATEYPLLRALLGIGTAPKDFVTQEVQRVGVPGQSVYIRETGDYPLDRVVAENYNRVLEQELPAILESEEYQALGTPADQRDFLQRYVFPPLKRAALAEARDQFGEEVYQGAMVRGEAARRKKRQLDLIDRLTDEVGPAPPDDTGASDLPPGFGPPPAGPQP